jgi:hypothetical protein
MLDRPRAPHPRAGGIRRGARAPATGRGSLSRNRGPPRAAELPGESVAGRGTPPPPSGRGGCRAQYRPTAVVAPRPAPSAAMRRSISPSTKRALARIPAGEASPGATVWSRQVSCPFRVSPPETTKDAASASGTVWQKAVRGRPSAARCVAMRCQPIAIGTGSAKRALDAEAGQRGNAGRILERRRDEAMAGIPKRHRLSLGPAPGAPARGPPFRRPAPCSLPGRAVPQAARAPYAA